MKPVEIRPGIYWVGVNDKTTDLFEGLWPVSKEGVSYNSYLIIDKKKVIVDLIKPIKTEEYLIGLEALTPIKEIDYIVLNHLEPDHAGLLLTFAQLAPQARFICSSKAAEMIPRFLKVEGGDRFLVVKDGDELDLGEKSLKFFSTPFLHWPETMMTYEKSQKILFSCDAFGGFGAIHGRIFDDEADSLEFYEKWSADRPPSTLPCEPRCHLRATGRGLPMPPSATPRGCEDPARDPRRRSRAGRGCGLRSRAGRTKGARGRAPGRRRSSRS